MSENYTRKAVGGAVLVVLLSFLGSGLGYVLRLLLARSLTPHEFGMVYAVIALFGLLYIFQHLGLNEALTWWIAKQDPKKSLGNIKSGMFFVVGFQMSTALVLAGIMIMMGDWIAQSYIGDSAAYALIVIHSAFLVLLPLESVFQSLFQGLHRMALYCGVNIARVSVVIVGSMILIQYGFGVSSVFWAYIIGMFIPVFVWIPLLERWLPGFWKAKLDISTDVASKLFGFGLPVIFTSVAHIVMGYTDTLMLTATGVLEDVGIYNAAAPTASLLWVFAASISIVTFPLATHLWEKKKVAEIKTGVEVLYKFAVIAIMPLALTFIAYPDLILGLLFGPEYVEGAIVLQVLSLGGVVYTIARVNDAVFSGMGKPNVSSKIAAAGALVNVVGNIVLIPMWGMVGAAVSTVTGFLVMFLWGLYRIKSVIVFDIPVRSWIATGLASGLFLYVVDILGRVLQLHLVIEAVICVIGGGIVYVACLFMGQATSIAEIKQIISRIQR